MKVKHLLPLFLLPLLACQQEKPASIVPVESIGTLKQIMQEGDITAKIDLETLTGRPQLYGLGAAENLQGEIMIWQGKAFLTTVAGSGLATYDGFRKKASLLVYSEVSDWDSIPLPAEIDQLAQLEDFLGQTAQEMGIDAKHPFPFLLKGRPEMVSWHVIDWDINDPIHTHAKHLQSGMRSGWKNTPTEVLGFYSPTPGVFTHHDSRIHLHATTPDRRLVAHLDEATGISGMHLYLPSMKDKAQ
ncbi:MAG: hypothetical protein KTR30_35020 [Saprospiraceae bacterium]|nr:hypothetical protein [Saprospiraceae bacterium]